MIRTLSIGHASYDIYVQMEGMPKENSKERFINKIACGGGNAANVAYLLGKWGVSSTFAGVVGNDVFGNRIKKERTAPICSICNPIAKKSGTSYMEIFIENFLIDNKIVFKKHDRPKQRKSFICVSKR